MTATISRISGLHGHGLEALKRAGEIVDEAMTIKHAPRVPATVTAWREREARRSALNQPPIVRETCAFCISGSYTIGTRRYVCPLCNGRGSIAVES